MIPRDTPGFTRGRKLAKMGLHSQDTAELFFNQVKVPASHVLGEPHLGFPLLMFRAAASAAPSTALVNCAFTT